MADIKFKEKSNIKIKKLDKSKIYSQKLKENIVDIKEKANGNDNYEESTAVEYASNQVTQQSKKIANKGANSFCEYGKRATEETKVNIQNIMQKIKPKMQVKSNENKLKIITNIADVNNQNRQIPYKNIKEIKVKNDRRIIANISNMTENIIQTTNQLGNKSNKGLKKAYQITKTTAKKTVATIKSGIKKTISAVRAIIASMNALISVIIAGRLDCHDNNCNNLFYSLDL